MGKKGRKKKQRNFEEDAPPPPAEPARWRPFRDVWLRRSYARATPLQKTFGIGLEIAYFGLALGLPSWISYRWYRVIEPLLTAYIFPH
jgi:hypothetical protein